MPTPTVSQLLACDVQHDGHMHRYLFDDNTVRYIVIVTGPQNHHFHDQELPQIPAENWNWATIDIDRQTGLSAFQRVMRRHRDSPSDLFGCPIVVKVARFDHEIPDIQRECDVYKKILGKGIGPKFLAYVTEGGRTIGFVLRKLEGARHLKPRDFTRCKRVLKKLHRLGILHQDCHHGNVLVKNGRAILIDFKSATEVNQHNAVEGKKQDFATLRRACGMSH